MCMFVNRRLWFYLFYVEIYYAYIFNGTDGASIITFFLLVYVVLLNIIPESRITITDKLEICIPYSDYINYD